RRRARAHRIAVHMHGAGTALRDAAAELGAGEAELLANHPEQRGVARLLGLDFPAVDDKRDHFSLLLQGTAIVRRMSGTENTTMVRIPRLPAIGRSKNASRRPSALIIELMKFSSSIAPSTRPRMAGAIGKPFSSMT